MDFYNLNPLFIENDTPYYIEHNGTFKLGENRENKIEWHVFSSPIRIQISEHVFKLYSQKAITLSSERFINE